jgi:2-phospho-L-lactate/phosphoenolpyruvate guanylyltransferase
LILVPVKNLSSAKQRLSEVLDQRARTRLAQAMLEDVLTTLHDWQVSRDASQVALVTSDPFAVKLAGEYSFELIADPENPGETGAVEWQPVFALSVEWTGLS